MIYFTSDQHFNHRRMAEMRSFKSVDTMNETLITNHNSVVRKRDSVISLGDFVWGNSEEDVVKILDSLNFSKMIFIRGNHDQALDKLFKNEELLKRYQGRIELHQYKEMKINGIKIILFHYPIEDWEGQHRGTIHLHGHEHITSANRIVENRKNMNVEFTYYTPVTINDIFLEFGHSDHNISQNYKL